MSHSRHDAAVENPPDASSSNSASAKTEEQARIFQNRLQKLARHLRRWPARGITCYRLYDHDIPEVPLVVDRYEDKLHIAEYAQEHVRSPEEHRAWLDVMARVACEVSGVAPENTFQKRRQRQEDFSQYERQGDRGRVFAVSEGGLKFLVNLSDYLDTGLFLDHRVTRSMVRDESRGKRFLNLFAYTGSFTVYAAQGGAVSTTTVDLSNTYLDWAQRNLRENKLDGPRHHFVKADVQRFLKEHPVGEAYDLAVVDPPTFSKSKMTEGIWDVQKHHAELLNRVIALLSPGGIVFFSTNFRRFKLAESEIQNAACREISSQTVPGDFHDRKIHRCWRIVKASPSRSATPR